MKDFLLKLIDMIKAYLGTLDKPKQSVDLTPWMTEAKKDIGQKEIPGGQDNPFIVDCFKYTTYKATDDETPWCAAYVCMRLEKAGFKSTKSAAAASYDKYGMSTDLVYGSIVTIKHASGGRHVTFCYDVQPGHDSFLGLGGNQGDAVKVSSYPKSHIVATRLPVKV